MIVFAQLWFTFFRIGVVSYGGGYVIITYILDILQNYGWVAGDEFANLVGLSYITPGAIAINAATYIGYRTAGLFGAFCSTFGVALPSILYMAIISRFSKKLEDNAYFLSLMDALKPAATAFMASAVVSFIKDIFFIQIEASSVLHRFTALVDMSKYVNPISILIAAICFVLFKLKAHTVIILGVAATLGVLLF